MPSDPTRTATRDASRRPSAIPWGLVLVQHPDPALHGVTRPVAPGSEVVLGREGEGLPPGTLDDDRISRRHAVVSATATGLRVTDKDSRNGTFVDGRRVQSAPLPPGSVLRIGPVLFVVAPLSAERLHMPHPRLAGTSASLGQVLVEVERVAGHGVPVLLQGEPGTGKELVAREIHRASGRRGPLVSVNCATLPDSLVQSELFGHAKGAFSGAAGARTGLVGQAEGGTLLLDELGEASPALQTNLLRLLQEGEARPVGSDRVHTVDVRFVAATNRDLVQAVREGRFREDLHSRIAKWVVHLPPLRERREDILPLARLLAGAARGRPVGLEPELAERLLLHRWPGNVRALDGVATRLALGSDDDPVGPAPWLDDALRVERAADADVVPQRSKITAERLRAVLARHHGNVSAAAVELEVARNTVYRWVKRFDIDPEQLR